MKKTLLFISIVIILFSCTKPSKKGNEIIKGKNSSNKEIYKKTKSQEKKFIDYKIDSIINNIKLKSLPIIDTTNFDNTIHLKKFYNKKGIEILKIKEIYSTINNSKYQYKIASSYRLKLSKMYHTIVLIVFKGEHELESILINYGLNGNIIGHKLISYDEIAEGMFQINSEIKDNKILINEILWTNKKKITKKEFRITKTGKIKPVNNYN